MITSWAYYFPHRTDKRTNRQTFVNRLVKWRKKEHGNWYIFHMCHTIVTIDNLKRSLCHKDSKSVLKVDMNWWEGCFKERLTHRTDKRTDRQTFVNRLVTWRKKEHGNWSIFHMCHTIVPIDSWKRSLRPKDSKSVFKVDITRWEVGFYSGITDGQTNGQTDRFHFIGTYNIVKQKMKIAVDSKSIPQL